MLQPMLLLLLPTYVAATTAAYLCCCSPCYKYCCLPIMLQPMLLLLLPTYVAASHTVTTAAYRLCFCNYCCTPMVLPIIYAAAHAATTIANRWCCLSFMLQPMLQLPLPSDGAATIATYQWCCSSCSSFAASENFGPCCSYCFCCRCHGMRLGIRSRPLFLCAITDLCCSRQQTCTPDHSLSRHSMQQFYINLFSVTAGGD